MNLKSSLLMASRFILVFLLLVAIVSPGTVLSAVNSPLQPISAQEEGFVLIGNNTGFSSVKWKQVISVFKGEKNLWTNGLPVLIVLPASGSALSQMVSKRVYNTTPSGVQKYWLSLVFQGRGRAPEFLPSDEEVIRFVAQHPGAIGFISVSSKSKAEAFIISVTD